MLPKRPYARAARIAPALQQNLARILQSHYQNPDLGLVTINYVDLARDLSSAKIFISFLQLNQHKHAQQDIHAVIESYIAELNQQTPKIRHLLASAVKLKYMPELRFVFDKVPLEADKIDALLKNQVKFIGTSCKIFPANLKTTFRNYKTNF